MPEYILPESKHMPLQQLIDSTRRVTVDGKPATFAPTLATSIITYRDPKAGKNEQAYRVPLKDLLFRGVWVGERTIIFEDRTLVFFPDEVEA